MIGVVCAVLLLVGVGVHAGFQEDSDAGIVREVVAEVQSRPEFKVLMTINSKDGRHTINKSLCEKIGGHCWEELQPTDSEWARCVDAGGDDMECLETSNKRQCRHCGRLQIFKPQKIVPSRWEESK